VQREKKAEALSKLLNRKPSASVDIVVTASETEKAFTAEKAEKCTGKNQ
jgi:hypothetical protein